MLDFLVISTRSGKRGIIEIYPKFIIRKSSDLMIRGGDFYAIWIEERGLWSTDEQDAVDLIDRELDRYAEENCKDVWWQMIQLLPSSYNQKRTVMLNYEVLANIYQHRRNHKLDEWRELCKWIEDLPYSEVITCNVAKEGD